VKAMSDFFNMGGYGAYIWSVMLIALFFMLLEPIMLILQRRTILQEIKRNQRLEERRSRDKSK